MLLRFLKYIYPIKIFLERKEVNQFLKLKLEFNDAYLNRKKFSAEINGLLPRVQLFKSFGYLLPYLEFGCLGWLK